ncbi:MAG: hypothetical protein KatS3mg092_0593 [Patescibacteria group bacterium]|nr:MAG: hypothetical protein KatS3mg092_0593 [Patescibacteria group bacterium]
MKKFFFIFILLLAIFLRFYNLNWDNNQHLHPDERFLTMVANAMKIPDNFQDYFNQEKSTLSPYNLGYKFYVYGTFPLVLTKYLAVKLGLDNYNDFAILGRFLSALMDFLCVVLVYKIGRLLINEIPKLVWDDKKKNIPIFISFFYAISVYPIQSAHFFTTDTFLNFFMLGSFYFALKFCCGFRIKFGITKKLYFVLSALFFSLALSSKISALYILPLNLAVIFVREILNLVKNNDKKYYTFHVIRYTFHVLCYTLLVYFFLRLFNPYYFQNPSFFDFRLNKDFVDSINSLKFFTTKEAWYPPGVQWINKPWYGLLLTTFLVGLGPVNFMVMVIGIIKIISNIKYQISNIHSKYKKDKKINLESVFINSIIYLVLFWVVGYFIYQSSQFVKSIRYTIYLYPFYAIFGGVGIALIFNQINKMKLNNFLKYVIRFTFYVTLLFWPLLFFTIYFHKNTRVEASEWIYKNVPNQAVILGEHWDDPLPLLIENNYGKNFQVLQLPIFDPDKKEKWQIMKNLLEKADYYVLSSNRGWGSIPKVPERYPLMSKFYDYLFKEKCFSIEENCFQDSCHSDLTSGSQKKSQFCFKKIKEFLPFYYQFIRYPDSWVEETFTVYDQQTVLIYEKNK